MSPKRHISRLIKEVYKMNEHNHLYTADVRLKAADVELAIYELQKILEKGKDYERNN